MKKVLSILLAIVIVISNMAVLAVSVGADSYAEPGDSSSIPYGSPAIWINGSAESDLADELPGTLLDDNSVRMKFDGDDAVLSASVAYDKSYFIEDFPYAMVLLRNYCTCSWTDINGDWEINKEDFECDCGETISSSVLTGSITQDSDYHVTSQMDDFILEQYKIGNDHYSYFVVDYCDGVNLGDYSGRINGIDITLQGFRTADEERNEFDLVGIGWFANIDDIENFFADKMVYYEELPEGSYAPELPSEGETETVTENIPDVETEYVSGEEIETTEVETEDVSEDITEFESEDVSEVETEDASETESDTANKPANEDFFEYTISNGEATISHVDYDINGDVVIPSTLGGYPVTCIAEGAFINCSEMTSITIPASVISIERYAFYRCYSLTSITIPDSVTSIGKLAFAECVELASISLPNSITYLAEDAFNDCPITMATICTDHIFYIPRTKLKTVILTNGSSIGDSAFENCTRLTSITFPNSVTSIGDFAFTNCYDLKSINFIGTKAEWDAIEKGECWDNCLGNGKYKIVFNYGSPDETETEYVSGEETETEDVSEDITEFESEDISEDITEFESEDVSEDITEFESEDVSGEETEIQYFPISEDVLKYFLLDNEITISGVDESIREYLSGNVIIPSTLGGYPVTCIGEYAFSGCSGLTGIAIPNSITNIGNYAFYDCTSLTNIKIPDTITSISDGLFSRCVSLTSIKIPDSVASIGVSAFSDCHSLTSIKIPDIVTSIGAGAFSSCTDLASIIIPDGVTEIYEDTFLNCTSLESINVPDSVWNIGDRAFYDCTVLTNITIGTSSQLTNIGDEAFLHCTRLVSIVIPNGVANIGEYAFYYCTNLETIYFSGTEDKWNSIIKSSGLWDYETGILTEKGTYEIIFNYGSSGEDAKVSQVSVTLDGDIGVNFYWTLTDNIINDIGAYFLVTLPNGETEKIFVSEASTGSPVGSSTEYYKITGHVAAKEMAENIKVELFAGNGALISNGSCSVRDYAELVFEYASDDIELTELMKQMLNYGASSQMLFDYKTDDLANNILDDNDKIIITVTEDQVTACVLNGNVSGIINEEFSCVLETKTTLRHYFSITAGTIDDYTFTVDGNDATPIAINKNGEDWYYVDIPNISAADLATAYVFSISKNGETQTITASVYSYINAVVCSDQSEALDNTVYTMYAYSQAAKAYFADNN